MNWKRAVAAVAACTLCLAPLMGCAQEKPQDSDLGGDVLAAIPMSPDSSASSFNVGCAATVLFYEAVRQRGE